jgi:hypothetical protein
MTGQPGPDEPGAGPADETREFPRPTWESGPPEAAPEPSPWSREAAGAQPPPAAPAFPPAEPRFAGPGPYAPTAYQPPYAPPTQPQSYGQPAAPPYGAQQPYGGYGPQPDAYSPPWAPPGQPPYAPGWGDPAYASGPGGPPPSKTRRAWYIALAVVLVLAAAGGLTAGLLSGSDDSGAPAAGPTPAVTSPPATGPGTTPSAPAPSPSPSTTVPRPSTRVPTPPGLAAIGYRAYSLRELTPSSVAIDENEIAQFRRYGLSRVVSLQALTAGRSTDLADDWDASITVLTFRDAAAAKAELDYSNAENKKTGRTIALPGFPDVTAFVNDDDSNGLTVAAFDSTGKYQVIVTVGGLSAEASSSPTVVAAEAARVLRAVLPDAREIATADTPPAGGGQPNFPTPSPTGTRA